MKQAAVIEPQIAMIEYDTKIKLGIREAMDTHVQFFNGIQCQISKYSLSPNSSLFVSA
ncbi:MAG: hypothetical protein V7K47_27130 [Nostoc sp.]